MKVNMQLSTVNNASITKWGLYRVAPGPSFNYRIHEKYDGSQLFRAESRHDLSHQQQQLFVRLAVGSLSEKLTIRLNGFIDLKVRLMNEGVQFSTFWAGHPRPGRGLIQLFPSLA